MPDGAGLPGWPRALREEWAAAYLGMSPSLFRATVAPEVAAVRLSPGRVAWLREDLDAWLDRRAGKPVDRAPPPRDAALPEPATDDAIRAALAALPRPRRARRSREAR